MISARYNIPLIAPLYFLVNKFISLKIKPDHVVLHNVFDIFTNLRFSNGKQ